MEEDGTLLSGVDLNGCERAFSLTPFNLLTPQRFRKLLRVLVLPVLLTLGPGWVVGAELLPARVSAVVAGLRPIQKLAGTNELRLAIGLPLRNQADLAQYLRELYDPAHPNYRHYLTPEEFATRFGPTEEDYQAVTAFARNNGLMVGANLLGFGV